jgi:hypothetical protein
VTVAEFVGHPAITMSGASPDGYVGEDGLLEIKCPNTATHIDTLLGEPIDGRYLKQMQWQMACTGRQWCDFASFDPRLPTDLQLKILRMERDDALIASLEDEVRVFLKENPDRAELRLPCGRASSKPDDGHASSLTPLCAADATGC